MKWSALLMAGAVALAASACSGDDSPAKQTVTSEPQASPEGTPSVATSHPRKLLEPVAPILRKEHYPAGTPVTAETGVVVMDPKTGDFEAWSSSDPSRNPGLSFSRDGAIITVSLTEPYEHYVVNRATGATFELPEFARAETSIASGTSTAVWTNINNGELFLVDLETGAEIEVGYTRPNLREGSSAMKPDGTRFALGNGTTATIVEMATGRVIATVPGFSGHRVRTIPGGRGFMLVPFDEVPGTPAWLDWDGNPLSPTGLPHSGVLTPDGGLTAEGSSVGRVRLGPSPTHLILDFVTIRPSKSAEPAARFLGAQFISWASDNSLLLLERGGLTLFSLDGTRIAHRDTGALPGDYFIPSPADPLHLAINGGAWHFETGALVRLALPDGMLGIPWWTPDGSELLIRLSFPGGEGGRGRHLLPVRFQAAPFGEPRYTVNVGADCLNLREFPSVDAASRVCLASGTTLAPAEAEVPSFSVDSLNPVIGVVESADRTWLHVASDDAIAGWVDAAYLEWAP